MGVRVWSLIARNALLILLPALLILSACWNWLTVDPAPSVVLTPAAGQLNFYNRSGADLQVWGDQFEGFPPDIEKQGQIVPIGGLYSFPTDRLKAVMLSTVGNNGEKRVPFEVYFSDLNGRNYIARFYLIVKMTSANMTIQPQQLGLRLANRFNAGSN